jgi:hypothetical protein
MSKFTFIYDDGNVKNTMEFEEDLLNLVLNNVEDFLRGCGYVFNGINIAEYSYNFDSTQLEDTFNHYGAQPTTTFDFGGLNDEISITLNKDDVV